MQSSQHIEDVLLPRTNDIGGFTVHRVLPAKKRQMVGPFIFWDQMGPGEFLSGDGVDVRPHPHIGLSTVTYLFSGSLDHKDSLGNDIRITPGEVNLMTAGCGIVHSERTGQDVRKHPSDLFGIQSWMAQPKDCEQGDPEFAHFDQASLPTIEDGAMRARIILGSYQGVTSPVVTQTDTLYMDVRLPLGQRFVLPKQTEERAIYIIDGEIELFGTSYGQSQMIIVKPGQDFDITARTKDTHLMVLGGATMDGPRRIWWNFVASTKELMEDAKQRWKNKRFDPVPGDTEEFIPLPST